jgi:hypothetical protein
MPFTETGAEKVKRKAYEKGNRERGIEQEAKRDYQMFGTTEQNIPMVNPMGDVVSGGEMARPRNRNAQTMLEALGAKGMKKGGSVSKADMQKAGFYDKDKTKSERQEIVSKVTTKPQRIAMVEKAFSSKNMKSGGSVSASKRADGCAIRGKTRA